MLKPDIENITVFSDASFCADTKAGGGAFWARGDVIKASDAFQLVGAEKSHEAELMTACQAIFRIAEHPELGPILARGPKTRIVLVVDCEAIRDTLGENKDTKMSKATRAMVLRVRELKKSMRFWLKVNHVKAHSGKATPRQWVNDWCDKNAYEQMRQMRDKILKGQV